MAPKDKQLMVRLVILEKWVFSSDRSVQTRMRERRASRPTVDNMSGRAPAIGIIGIPSLMSLRDDKFGNLSKFVTWRS